MRSGDRQSGTVPCWRRRIDLANAIFWGLWLLPFGLLVYRPRFLPRLLGVWLILGCFGWLAFSVTGFLLPEDENQVYAFGQLLTLGEVATMLWLVLLGAKERAPAGAAFGERDWPAAEGTRGASA